MEGRLFVLGDIHGAYKALIQVLERSKFDYEKDTLIFLGDVCDGWSETKECVDELLKIKNLIYILGNHDLWFIQFYYKEMKAHWNDDDYMCWTKHGGQATLNSYGFTQEYIQENVDSEDFTDLIPTPHLKFFKRAVPFYELGKNIYTHAGFIPNLSVDIQDLSYFAWDRTLINKAYQFQNKKQTCTFYEEIYLGHTPTIGFNGNYKTPQHWTNIWACDTGAAFTGKLSLMDVNTKELFQSDECMKLYPDETGRNKQTYNSVKGKKFS